MSFFSTEHFEKQTNSEPLNSKSLSQCKSDCDELSLDGSKSIDQKSPERTLNSSDSGDISAISRFGHDFSQIPTHSDTVQGTQPLLRTGVMVQRFPEPTTEETLSAPETAPTPATAEPEEESAAPEETTAPALLVEDSATELAPGQMRKSEFLAQLRTAVTSTAESAMAGTGRTTADCPYLDYWFDYYSAQDAQHCERALRRYAPEASRVTTAREYIPIIAERVRRSVETWVRTGEITGIPEGMPIGMSGMGLLGSIGSLVSGIGGIFFKARDGGARQPNNPQAIQSQLGGGRSLDSSVRSRMESAFGMDFSHVRAHTDSTAAGLSDRLNARAFTVGEHVAFGSGEYKPGTILGDALIAHEMAHVVQQRGADSAVSSLQAGDSGYGMLERDADKSAIGALASLWGGAKGKLANITQNAMPRLISGLSLQRCQKVKSKEELKKGPKFFQDFAAKFPEAADLIRKSPAAMKLVKEAEAAGVKFGGYAEDGPGKDIGRAYTSGNKVYVPKAQTDKVMAMRDFLFELNNAIRAPKFAELRKEAEKGTKGTLTAKQYAYKSAKLEVEALLRLGEIWFKMKKTIGKDAKWNKYDNSFFLSEYKKFKEGKKTKDDIVKDVLKRVYQTGTLKGKTVEQYYIEYYNRLSGGK